MAAPESIERALADEAVLAIVEEAIGAATEGIAILSADGSVLAANLAAATLLGLEHPTLRGRRLNELIEGFDPQAGASEQHSARAQLPDGTVAELSLRVVELGSGGGTLAIGLDRAGAGLEPAERLIEIGERDPLTGLSNRRRFETDVERELARATRYGGGALLVLGLDAFGKVNASAGYRGGDELLREVSALIAERVRETDVAARLGGDQFGVVLTEVSADSARSIGDDIVSLIAAHPFELEGQPIRLGVSVGVAGFGEGPADAAEALSWAELAMRRAKAMGGGRTVAFQDSLLPDRERTMSWSQRIREALDTDSFVPYFQPILELASDSVSSWEVLIRMRGADDEVIQPESFVPTAERYGLIEELDLWVVRNAIEAMARHSERPGLSLEINLSGKSIGDPEMLTAIRNEITSSEIDPQRLIFEVTETAAIANLEQATRFGRELLELGCGFALDDFGTGFASFYYLKRLPLTHLKIDGDFIRGLADSPVDQLVVKAIVEIASGMNLKTIAEYVENAPTLELLRAFGVDYCQGFEVGAPAAPRAPDLIPPPYEAGGG